MGLDHRFDVVLRNGTVIDGSGFRAYRGDVVMRGDRLVPMAGIEQELANLEIRICGLVVAPGLIDAHTHDDASLIGRPQRLPKLTPGVTTVMADNCNISVAPYCKSGVPPDLLRLVFESNRFVAPTREEYLRRGWTPRLTSIASFF